jgi:urea transport system ATP-binding protein
MISAPDNKKHTPLVLSVEGVDKSFDGFKAINDLNFYLRDGELRTVIGPNGAGKSRFMDLVTARTKPDKGKIVFHKDNNDDVDLTRVREHKISQLGIGRKFQNPTVYRSHTVYDNLKLSLAGERGLLHSLFYRESKEDRGKIYDVMKTIRLEAHASTVAGALSHGQKQWLEIGMLLAQDPKIMLVDEPAAGMSDEETERTGELLLSLEGKHSLIVIEHDMEFVRQIASRVTVLHQGHVLKEGTFDFVKSDPKVIEVYLGRQTRKH